MRPEVHVGKYVMSDLETDALKIPTNTSWGHTAFQEGLRSPTADIHELQTRQLPLFALRHPEATKQLHELQTILRALPALPAPPAATDPRVRDSIEQIYWSPKSALAFLNIRAYVISALIVWKTLVLPGLSVVVPILSLIIPFLLLRFTRSVQVPLSDYMATMRRALLQQMSVPAILKAKHADDHLGHLFETGFLCIAAGTFISSIWNQIQTAIHQRRVAAECQTQGRALREVVKGAQRMFGILESLPDRLQDALNRKGVLTEGRRILDTVAHLGEETDDAIVYGWVWNTPEIFEKLKAWVGQLDVYVTIAGMPNICFPRAQAIHQPLNLRGVYHPGLQTPVTNDADFRPKPHVLLTGPNRGGKSAFCKAVGLAILCAQTWGFAFAAEMTYTPFAAIETALSPADVLGRLSLFESEIEFAKDVLGLAEGTGPMFVMMDEIFHSTNAHDGQEASRIFLEKLYKKPHVTSLISTHYRELVDLTGAEGWYMECLDTEPGQKLTYTYKVKQGGTSDKSSVFEILAERGLI
jgi:MutS domain V